MSTQVIDGIQQKIKLYVDLIKKFSNSNSTVPLSDFNNLCERTLIEINENIKYNFYSKIEQKFREKTNQQICLLSSKSNTEAQIQCLRKQIKLSEKNEQYHDDFVEELTKLKNIIVNIMKTVGAR